MTKKKSTAGKDPTDFGIQKRHVVLYYLAVLGVIGVIVGATIFPLVGKALVIVWAVIVVFAMMGGTFLGFRGRGGGGGDLGGGDGGGGGS